MYTIYFEVCLYYLRNDPDERHNFVKSPEHAKTRACLRAMLIKEMTGAGEAKPHIRPAVFVRKERGKGK